MLLSLAGARTPAAEVAPPAAPPALTDAERRDFATHVADLKSNDPETLDEALVALRAMGPKAVGALESLTGMLESLR